MTSYRIKAYTYLILVAIIWGVATPVIKFTLGGIGPLPFLTYRFAISTILAVLYLIIFKPNLRAIKNNLFMVLIYGFVVNTVALGILFYGMNNTTVLDTALISTIAPLAIALAGYIFLKEHITKRERVGISIAMMGTLFVVLAPLLLNGTNGFRLSGNILIFVYIVISAGAAVLSKKLMRKKVDPLTLTNISFIVGFVTILPITIFLLGVEGLTESITSLTPNYHLGVWYMALFSGTLAYTFWLKGQKTIEISEAGVFSYLTPIFAVPLGVLWLGESITTIFILGSMLITTGVIIAEYKKRRN